MTFDPNDVLRRFHRALVREIQASNPEHLSAPFSVAEIYQNLVPYRTHRDEIGVEMNADYEHALLRLLAGENDFLTIESRTARQEIREELESPNPNTGLYRDFAAADVRLNPEKIDEALMGAPGPSGATSEEEGQGQFAPAEASDDEAFHADGANLPEEEDPGETVAEEADEGAEEEAMTDEEMMEEEATEEVGASAEEAFTMEEAGEVDPEEVLVELSGEEVPGDSETEGEMAENRRNRALEQGSATAPANCAWCREALPQRTGVNFCPYCGCSVHLVPCPECGEELELKWRFCIACGTEVSS